MPGAQSNAVVTDTAMQDALQTVLRELLAPVARLEALRHKELLSGQEVEALYGLDAGTLENWRGKGKGPATTKIGQRVYYRHMAVQAFIQAHQQRTYDHQQA